MLLFSKAANPGQRYLFQVYPPAGGSLLARIFTVAGNPKNSKSHFLLYLGPKDQKNQKKQNSIPSIFLHSCSSRFEPIVSSFGVLGSNLLFILGEKVPIFLTIGFSIHFTNRARSTPHRIGHKMSTVLSREVIEPILETRKVGLKHLSEKQENPKLLAGPPYTLSNNGQGMQVIFIGILKCDK